MRNRNQRPLLWLTCFLLVSAGWSPAQAGFLMALKERPQAAVEPGAVALHQDKTEPLTLPAGTHLLMKLTSALHTTSATPGAGIYLEPSSPVITEGRVIIPEHTRVLGLVESGRRPGRVKGRAQMRFRFTTLILPGNHVLSIAGNLESLPGSESHRTVDDEGTLEPVDQIDADVYTVAKTTAGGILIGSVGHIGIGVGRGALIAAGIGVAKGLFTRGDAISLPVGTRVEMVLKRPLVVARPGPRDAM